MPKGGMSDVMSETNCFDEVFVETQCPSHRPRNLGDFERVCQARPVVVTLWCNKDLCFVFEASERFGMHNTVTITLEAGSYR
jgi:hypothetical protein